MGKVKKVFTTHSAAQTHALGAALGRRLGPGDVVALRGDLGSGKTCLIQGVCEALQVADYVTSPTFILINEYAGQCRGRALPVYHFDLYRLGGVDQLEELGAAEYFYGRGVCLVEWAERAHGLLPDRCCHVRLAYGGEACERRIILQGDGVGEIAL